MTLKKIALLAVLASSCSIALGASFDCSKAKTKTEKLICSTPATSVLDEKLGIAFKQAYARAEDKVGLRQAQRGWLAGDLNMCTDAACIQATITERIALLNQVAPAGTPAARWTGHFVRYENSKVAPDNASISILGLSDGRLNISGSAVWVGDNEGQVNTGEMHGFTNAPPAANVIQFEADGCAAQLTLRGDALDVADEAGCGGMNVSFNGHYQRRK